MQGQIDSLKGKVGIKEKLNFNKDSSLSKKLNKETILKNLKNIFPTGSISAGYDYGFLPYTVNMPSPASAFRTEGQVGLNVLNIPLDVTFFYSSQKNLIGLNNYFRVSYNADRYKDKLNNNLTKNIDGYKSQLGGLTAERQTLMQKMAYTDYLSSISPDKWPAEEKPVSKPGALSKTAFPADSTSGTYSNSTYSNGFNATAIKSDSSKYINQNLPVDTTQVKNNAGGFNPKADSTKYSRQYLSKTDSTQQIAKQSKRYKQQMDSVRRMYDTYHSKYDSISSLINEIQKKIKQGEDVTGSNYSAYLKNLPYFNKIQNFLSGVRKLDIGLCYPSSSTFMVSNIPVRGINFEFAKNDLFFAFTYGTTVSTLLYNNKNIDGFLKNVRNSYNYFDFNNLAAGRKVLSMKFGKGTKEGNHFFVGFMVGKGQSSYLNTSAETGGVQNRETNLVLEADGRYKLNVNTAFDIILGKSSVQGGDMNYDVLRSAMKEIWSPYRSYALLTRLSTKINATKTNLSCTVRWVDPYFKSFGLGFIRSDNLRYEFKLDQPITSKLRYTGMFRHEEDNLLNLMNYKNTFLSFNNTLSYKIKRGLTLKVSYTPLYRKLRSDSYSSSNQNAITTGVVSYVPKTRRVNVQFNLLYSYYLVNTDTQKINFQNFSYSHQLLFKNGFKTSFSLSWFKNNLRDSLGSNVYLGVLDAGYQFKNGSSLTVAGKGAYKPNGTFYPGFIVKGSLKLFKSIYWENQVEKFIVGDLFNGYNLANLKRFPYYCSTRLIFKF